MKTKKKKSTKISTARFNVPKEKGNRLTEKLLKRQLKEGNKTP